MVNASSKNGSGGNRRIEGEGFAIDNRYRGDGMFINIIKTGVRMCRGGIVV